MEILSRETGAAYRTQLLTHEHAEQFAACLRANDAFDGVTICESSRAKRECRWYVVYYPASSRAHEALLHRQEEARRSHAEAEADQYLFILAEEGRFYLCQSPSGEVYEVTLHNCTCPDAEYRCREVGIRCKHSQALEIAVQRGLPSAA